MKGIFKNRIVLGSGLLVLLNFLKGFVIASPILIYLRIIYENTESSLRLWPLPKIELMADFLINHNDVFIFYIITAAILYILYFFVETFFAGGIYRLIVLPRENPLSIKSGKDFLKSSSAIWTGYLKAGLFAVLVYAIAISLGFMFGNFLGRFSGFLETIIITLFILLGSTYLQILKIHIAMTSDTSLRAALAGTKDPISKGFLRILAGNISVSVVVFAAVLVFWLILKALKSSDWSVIVMIFTILVQQLMVLTVCFGQALRINFNYSVIKKGDSNALGGDELG